MSAQTIDSIIKESARRSDEYRRGFSEGAQAAAAKIQPEIAKLASAAFDRLVSSLEEEERFRGQVAMHAGAREVLRMKQSMAAGMCWDCGERAPAPTSPYRRCGTCDAAAFSSGEGSR